MSDLRMKVGQLHSWEDTAKSVRMSMMEKRTLMDSHDRRQLQKCLDDLQRAIKVTSVQTMVERLESISRQLGLRFTAGSSGIECFISTDTFYVEVTLDPGEGHAKDVRIAHRGEPSSCDELVQILRRGDFTAFTEHLQGLSAIYQISSDKHQKMKGYLALQSLEADLIMLAELQNCSISDISDLIHKSPLGILQPRIGGRALQLVYLVSPYELLDRDERTSITLSVENVIQRKIGATLRVNIEPSESHKLQSRPLMSVAKTQDGKSLPSFDALSNLNSIPLPACFTLDLGCRVAIATCLVRKIQAITNVEFAEISQSTSLVDLIVREHSHAATDPGKGLHVSLPGGQQHCYYFATPAAATVADEEEGRGSHLSLRGIAVCRVPFTHPTHVPQIVATLRRQAMFSRVVASCVRNNARETEAGEATMFEVTPMSLQCIIVTFQHPCEESIATVKFDLSDVPDIKCEVEVASGSEPLCDNEFVTKVMQRCWSIPITMRSLIRRAAMTRPSSPPPPSPPDHSYSTETKPAEHSDSEFLFPRQYSDRNSNEVKFVNEDNVNDADVMCDV
ncbi:PREDICTED: mediator of RNA polymerase II transcription subunit 1-like isoform X2 [Priapulus caudatus]|nr:PREDICTED: mediator of RNA polymerase II transcription subunit 1-like isoform X2 [Priapulus caudatus]